MKTEYLVSLGSLLQTRLIFEMGEGCDLHEHHSTHETYYVLAGHGQIRIGKEVKEVKCEDFILIEPNTPHRIINTGLIPLIVLSTKDSNENDTHLV